MKRMAAHEVPAKSNVFSIFVETEGWTQGGMVSSIFLFFASILLVVETGIWTGGCGGKCPLPPFRRSIFILYRGAYDFYAYGTR